MTVIRADVEGQLSDFASDVLAGLSNTPKQLSSRYFYDEEGSKLFQAIMALPEYYLTDAEFEIFSTQAETILKHFSEDRSRRFDLVEFGAGDGLKTKVLLDHFVEQYNNFGYYPVDISGEILEALVADCKEKYPIDVQGLNYEYFKALEVLNQLDENKKVVLFLGSNIGNFSDARALEFLQEVRNRLHPGDMLMLGVDLKKYPQAIARAYNDSAGITKAFNLNLLERINKELGGNFNLSAFDFYSNYDPITGQVRSYLISLKQQTVHIDAIKTVFEFQQWEPIHTEVSRKYDLRTIENFARNSGFEVADNLLDCKHYFLDSIWKAV